MIRSEQLQQAQALAQFVIERGRVQGCGMAWLECLRSEVEREADRRRLPDSDLIAEIAMRLYR